MIRVVLHILKMLEHINLNSERINQTDVYIYIRLRIIVLHGNEKKQEYTSETVVIVFVCPQRRII